MKFRSILSKHPKKSAEPASPQPIMSETVQDQPAISNKQRKKKHKAKGPHSKKRLKSPFANVKIAPKLLSGFLIIAILSAAMGAYASLSLSEVSAASEAMYGRILLPTKNAYDVDLNIKDQAMNLRQALLSDSESMILSYASTIKNKNSNTKNAISMIEALVSEDAEKTQAVAAFKPAYEQYEKALDDVIEKLKAGDIEVIKDDLAKFGDYRTEEYNVIKEAEKLRAAISNEAAAVATSNKRQSASVLLVTMIGIGVVVVLSVLIGIFIARGISRPVKKLTANVKQLAAGETDIALDERITRDEIGQMREAIRTIVTVIKDLLDDTGMLVSAADEGRLSVRADAGRHTGAFRRIVEGVNTTLDAMIDPINESAQVLSELAEGNLSVSVTGDFKGDFSLIKDALNSTISTLKAYIGDLTEALGEIAQGRLAASIDSDFKGEFVALKESFNQTVDAFRKVLAEIDNAAEEVATGTAQLSSGSQVISQGASEQASALEQLTASLGQISNQTRENVQSANAANDLSQGARESAAVGSDKMTQLQAAMEDIRNASASIGKIIKVIDDIALQTNILALNAAVEAARAGAHGRGFAVVADEVRNLAARSANAAKETTELIEGSIRKTEAGAKIADDTAAALADIVSGVDQTATLSAQIAQASGEQAAGIAQVDKGIEQLSQVVQNNTATAQQAAASSEQLSAQAEHLKAMVGQFKLTADEVDPVE